jgi:putative redox protein
MVHEVETQWMGEMKFNALLNGHTVTMDAPERAGGHDEGPIPKPFVLTALTGCTGMDVISILHKSHKQVTDFDIKVTGEISKQPPIEYTSVNLVYNFTGPENNKDAALKAVALSQEKYCGVSHMLKKIMPVTWQVIYNGQLIFNNKQATTQTVENINNN